MLHSQTNGPQHPQAVRAKELQRMRSTRREATAPWAIRRRELRAVCARRRRAVRRHHDGGEEYVADVHARPSVSSTRDERDERSGVRARGASIRRAEGVRRRESFGRRRLRWRQARRPWRAARRRRWMSAAQRRRIDGRTRACNWPGDAPRLCLRHRELNRCWSVRLAIR